MKAVKTILNILRNKYLLSLGAFAVMIVFIDRNDIFVQLDRKQQLKDLTESRDFYHREIEKTKKQLDDLQHNSAALEKYARENLYMKRDNEDVFIVEQPAQPVKK
ncbi:FtsB family cell division protein [Foetidibacter luteolus]|uniref:FtsB family cell division protein n=1 Tax=Foetidibacter luteolus TaxID=2608880 RepID=UPI00129B3ACB|nr:septum formation initiator family protein [Foetidibacter luteolus]